MNKFKNVFAKEMKNRRGEPEIPAKMLTCLHKRQADPFGGPHCMVCDFEITNKTCYCTDCDLHLCGSCWFKWKNKM